MNRVRLRTVNLRPSSCSMMGHCRAMAVKDILVFTSSEGETGYYVCPKCSTTLDREFVSYCDRCGQRLSWKNCENARVIYSQNHIEPHT